MEAKELAKRMAAKLDAEELEALSHLLWNLPDALYDDAELASKTKDLREFAGAIYEVATE